MSTTATATKTSSEGALRLDIVPAFLPLYELADHPTVRHFFLWGGRGGAKTTAMADFFAIQGRRERKTYLCTREVQNSLAESVYGAIKESIERIGIPGYYITDNSIDHQYGAHMVFAGLGYRNGQHVKSATNIGRAWTEEAQQIKAESLQVLTPTVRAKKSKLYYTFNRTLQKDAVYAFFLTFKTRVERLRCRLDDGTVLRWRLYRGDGAIGIEINYDGNPFFPDALEQDRQRDLRAAEETGDWAHYNHVWRGMPQTSGDSSILTVRQVIEATHRQADADGAIEVGADIARGGKDRVVFYKRQGMQTIDAREYRNSAKSEKMRITETAERLMSFAGKEARIKVDDTGLGGGVTDILEDRGYNVVGVNFAQAAVDTSHYNNAASEMWFDFAHKIHDAGLPDDIELIEELTERREGRRDSKGRRTVEKKDDFIERVGRSPDKADALLLCYYEPMSSVSTMDWVIA